MYVKYSPGSGKFWEGTLWTEEADMAEYFSKQEVDAEPSERGVEWVSVRDVLPIQNARLLVLLRHLWGWGEKQQRVLQDYSNLSAEQIDRIFDKAKQIACMHDARVEAVAEGKHTCGNCCELHVCSENGYCARCAMLVVNDQKRREKGSDD
jgi:hypothetical protein